MVFFALIGCAGIASASAAAFDIGDCDHLQITDGGRCVGTKLYGNNHDCKITVLENFFLEVRSWDVEAPSVGCPWDYLMINGKKYCGEPPATGHNGGEKVYTGEVMVWHTDYSVVKDGWKLCAGSSIPDVVYDPVDKDTRWCTEGNHDDFTEADSIHPGWLLHDSARHGWRWCGVSLDECKSLSAGIDGVIGFYMTGNGCCFPYKTECAGPHCPGTHSCGANDVSGTYRITCGVGEVHVSGTAACQVNGYTCMQQPIDGPRCCDGRRPERRTCVPCGETRLRKPKPAAPSFTLEPNTGRSAVLVPYSSLEVGGLVFEDRTYTWTNIGDYDADCWFTKVSNNDKNTPSSDVQYTITLDKPSWVYLDFWGGEYHAGLGFSTWNSGWTLSDKESTEFGTWGPGVVYKKFISESTLELMGNQGNGHGTYYAFICPMDTNMEILGNGACRFEGWTATRLGYISTESCVQRCDDDPNCVAADVARPNASGDWDCHHFFGDASTIVAAPDATAICYRKNGFEFTRRGSCAYTATANDFLRRMESEYPAKEDSKVPEPEAAAAPLL